MSGCYLLNSFNYLLFILVLVCFIVFHFFSSFTDYKTDPYSEGDPCKSICCRADLRSQKASPSGCYDTKVICIAVKQYCNLFLLLFLAHLRLPMPAALFFIVLFFFTRSGDRFSHGQRLPRGGGERADDSRRTPSVHVGQFQQHQPPGPATILQLHLRQDAAASFQAMRCMRCMRVTETDKDCSLST